MEFDGVVSVALQRAEAVVMCVAGRRVIKGVGNCLGEHWVRADLDEGAVGGAGGGDGLAEPDRVTHVGHPVVGIEQRCGTGILDCADDRDERQPRRQTSQRLPQLRQDGIHHRMVGRDIHVHPAGERVLLACPGDDGVNGLGWPGDHGLAR